MGAHVAEHHGPDVEPYAEFEHRRVPLGSFVALTRCLPERFLCRCDRTGRGRGDAPVAAWEDGKDRVTDELQDLPALMGDSAAHRFEVRIEYRDHFFRRARVSQCSEPSEVRKPNCSIDSLSRPTAKCAVRDELRGTPPEVNVEQ